MTTLDFRVFFVSFCRSHITAAVKADRTMTYQRINPYNGEVLKSFDDISDRHLESALATASTRFET